MRFCCGRTLGIDAQVFTGAWLGGWWRLSGLGLPLTIFNI